MKIKSKIYAELLLESIKENVDMKKIAANFWHLLQKNKQYKDLPAILNQLETLHAEKSGAKIAYVETGKELTRLELEIITNRLKNYIIPVKIGIQSNIILKTKINPSITGITAKIDNQIIDLSLENKILKLRKTINI
jgi:F0F1-type ATP synthase delta subunit